MELYTIGYGNMNMNEFIGLLKENKIEVVVDVRSIPYSRFMYCYNKDNIEKELRKEGINYVFMGDVLGGKPKKFDYIADIYEKYERIRKEEGYKEGIKRLIEILKTKRVVIMCCEKDFHNCHRYNLIGKDIEKEGIRVINILCNGRHFINTDNM